jgi:hypothetical protein
MESSEYLTDARFSRSSQLPTTVDSLTLQHTGRSTVVPATAASVG